ncbi:MAG TPA: hypothetical protein VLB44_01285, partial [Kofleriaceae bacterium]|nr:hypothetical protein [Kofleriaceae bacterium]
MRILLVAVLIAACGKPHSGTPDASGSGSPDASAGSDASVDSGPDVDADPNVRGTVVVHVVDKNGAPLAGMHVVFIDTDQTVTHITTDAAGAAQASVYPNANVTVVRERSGGAAYSLTTVEALNPGDDIKLISADGAVSSAEDPFSQRTIPLATANLTTATKSGSTGTFTTAAAHGLAVGDSVVVSGASITGYNGTWVVASVPTTTTFTANIGSGGLANATGGLASKALRFTVNYPSFATAQSYMVYTPCGPIDVGTSVAPSLALQTACTGSTMDVVVIARGTNGVPLAYTQKAAVAVSANGSTTITDTWHALDTVTATYANPTTRVTDIAAERYVPYVRTPAPATGSTTTTGGTANVTLSTPSPAIAMMKTRLRCPNGSSADCISNAIGTATQTITQQVDGTAATYSLDIAANLLPWASAVYNPSTTTLEVTVTGTGAIDLFEANLRYTGATSTPRGQVIYTWR